MGTITPLGPTIGSLVAISSAGGTSGICRSQNSTPGSDGGRNEVLGCHGITANCLCPGYVLTEMGADTRTTEDVELWSSYSPLGRLGDPADVSAVAAFLASPDAAYLTGQAVNVTGGMVMH